jgi:hypothetical protein
VALWLSKKLVLAVESALSHGETGLVSGPVAGWSAPKLTRNLRTRGLNVVDLDSTEGVSGSYAALIVGNIAKEEDWADNLPGLIQMLEPGAQLIAVDRGSAHEVSRRLLCAGLTDLRQREVGRQVVTTGRAP